MNIKTNPVDWCEVYDHSDTNVWKIEPHQYTIEAAKRHMNGGSALDLGCGEGHDAIYLARSGYTVKAIDISETALRDIQNIVSRENLSIETEIKDITELKLERSYDLIVSYGFLHFIGKNDYRQYINHLKEHTNMGGLHAFYTFGDVGNFHDIGKHRFWFPNCESIASLYDDWKIIETKERTIETLVRGDRDEPLYNSLIKIIAQK